MRGTTALVALAAGASAHLCTLSPLQRGGAADAGTPGSDQCLQLKGPCGSVPAGAPTAAYLPAQRVELALMKNLDHFNAGAPGNFSAWLWDASGKATFLGSTLDTSGGPLSVYPLRVTIPVSAQPGAATLQTAYLPNNGAAPAAFYQCSDVMVLKPNATREAIREAHIRAGHGKRRA